MDNLNKREDFPVETILCEDLGSNGRLGNQFFQIANAYALSREYSAILYLKKQPYFKYFDRLQLYSSEVRGKATHIYHEEGFNYKQINLISDSLEAPAMDHRSSPIFDVKGYFQSEKYFKKYELAIRNIFVFNEYAISKLISKLLDPLHQRNFAFPLKKKTYVFESTELKNVCAVHVRRGDYVDNSFYNNLDESYYSTAMGVLEKQFPNINRYIVFSDDLDYCMSLFSKTEFDLYRDKIIFEPKGLKEIETLKFMSLYCGHFIIANSSFSWWGAWLSRYANKHIIFPGKWFGPGSHVKDWKDIYFNEGSRTIIS